MNTKRIYAIYLRQWYLIRDNPTRLFAIFVWIILDIILWGFITKYLDKVGGVGFSFVPVFLGAILLWDFLIRVSHGVMVAFLEDFWSRNMINIFTSPITLAEYTVGLTLTSILTSTAGLLIMLLLAGSIFGFSVAQFGALLVPFLLILFMFGIAVGITTLAILLRFGQSAEWLAWPIPMLMSPFVGVFYPVEILPGWMQAIAAILPPSYVFDGIRAVVFDHSFEVATLVWGIGLCFLYILGAYALFKHVYKQSVRSGLLARHSAESAY